MVSKRAPDGNGSTQSDRTLVCLTTMPIPVRVLHFELTLASANDALDAVEDFAQIGVVSLFANVNPGGLDPAFRWTWHCLLNQFTIYNAFQSDSMTPGGVCTRRWADSATISTRAAKTAPGEEVLPKPGNVLGMPGVFAIPFEVRTDDTVFGTLVINQTESEAAAVRQDAWAEETNAVRRAKRAQRIKS